MNLKKQVIAIATATAIILLLSWQLAGGSPGLKLYGTLFYNWWQPLRGFLFNWLPLSLGDVLYVAAGVLLLLSGIKGIRNVFKAPSWPKKLLSGLLAITNIALWTYIAFLLGWGANYNKQPLGAAWALNNAADTLHLGVFDSMLVNQLNSLAPGYHPAPLAVVSDRAARQYQMLTDSKVAPGGLHIKYSLFGYFLERLAIEGYYNPFTGEGQVSDRLPGFMLPFVVSHEMAHQAGIAAEGDANLMAYAVSTAGTDTDFQYSAALNIWLYVDRRLHRLDSNRANRLAAGLNKRTKAHMDTLETLSQLYDNEASRYSTAVYDSYLKMQHQKDGIRSYGSVTLMAWRLLRKRERRWKGVIEVP